MRLNAPYITFRNGHPYFMMRVPTDLVDKFNVKFIRKSLKAQVTSEAMLLAEAMTSRARTSFTLLRSGILSDEQEKAIISSYVFKRGKPSKRKSVHLNDLYKLYYAEKSPNWVGRTSGELNAQFEGIVKVIGNLSTDSIDRAVLLAGRQKLLERLSVRTANKYMTLLSSVLRWAVKHEYIIKNPAEGLQLELKKRADEERKAYDREDINKIFQYLPSKDGDEPFKFWIPMIAMYSGMRREEICQLNASDIREVDGVRCFDVNDGKGKSLKTKSSARLVPVHPKLIQLGVLDFVDANINKGENLWGFKQWKGTWGKQFGNWWSIYFNRQKITTDTLKTFHSFRHTVANELKQKGVQESLIAEILGHSNNSITTGRYGKRYMTEVLLSTLSMIDYDH